MIADKIVIKNWKVKCCVGCYEFEKFVKRDLIVSIVLSLSLNKACMTDNLSDTFDYSALQKRIYAELLGTNFNLIERVAQKIADVCLDNSAVKEVLIRVEKPGAIPFAETVAVEITRNQIHNKAEQ